MTVRATPATAEAITGDLRRWTWDGLRKAFSCETERDAPTGTASRWGQNWEVVSITGIIPCDPGQYDMGAAMVRLVDSLCRSVTVERPGGVLVVRGPFDPAEASAIPGGIEATVSPIGSHAYRVRLAVIGHAATLEQARAQRRAIVKATL
jgi:hypothetical protein